jgi:hypothetical protein
MKENLKYFMIGAVFGFFLFLFVILLNAFMDSMTLFEDGSFEGCIPFALCYFG